MFTYTILYRMEFNSGYLKNSSENVIEKIITFEIKPLTAVVEMNHNVYVGKMRLIMSHPTFHPKILNVNS